MSKKDILSAWNLEFDADILDSTEYLRREFVQSIRQVSKEYTPLRITQDLTSGLKSYASTISPFEWLLHEPELLGELYRAQEQEGANVAIAQSGECFTNAESNLQGRKALFNALKEAEGNNAVWFLGNLDVHILNNLNTSSEIELRKAKMALLEQLKSYDEFGVHGVWICVDKIDWLDIILESLRLAGAIPFVLSIQSCDIEHVNLNQSVEMGLSVRFDSLAEAIHGLNELVCLQDQTNTHLILEFNRFDMSEENAYQSIEFLKEKGLKNFRPGANMTRKDRVLLYSFI